MSPRLIWDEAKRQANLAKHGLDFKDAAGVFDSRYASETESEKDYEWIEKDPSPDA